MADMDQVREDYQKFFKSKPPTPGLLTEKDLAVASSQLETLLAERRTTYGPFGPQATIAQSLKLTMRNTHNWPTLKAPQKEALEMIGHKIARILNGDPNLEDSWKDIAGYALRAIDPT